MSDYIKREDVMKRRHGCDRDCKSCDFFTDGDSWCQGEIFVVDLLCVPSADVVERKKGKWTDHSGDGYVECPFCDSATNCDGNIEELHFCFSCGAEMESE